MNSSAPSRVAGRWDRVDALAALALLAPWAAALLLPALAQWPEYHAFADQRTLLGVPHACNVVSNLPLLLVGAYGLAQVRRCADAAAAPGYALFFAGALLTAFGSAWYHLDPRDATLVWDRLPIALGFAGLVAATLTDRRPRRAVPFSLAFAAVGVGTVFAWVLLDDLVPYFAMQAGFVAAALYATAFVPSRFTHAGWILGAAALYGVALAAEQLDRAVFAATVGVMSGHTLKHLVGAAAIAVVVAMLRNRRRIGGQ